MTFETHYRDVEPTRADVDALTGGAVIEFGAPWCPICQGAQQLIGDAMARHPRVQHMKVEDGPGRPLGRSFRVKLWPTLIVLKDGVEATRVVRPTDASAIDTALAQVDT